MQIGGSRLFFVGRDLSRDKRVGGIIDYLREYTFDKAMEDKVKSIAMVIGKSAGTIQNPEKYKSRFRSAMGRYFMVSPDKKSKRLQMPKMSLDDAVRDIRIQC